jgi:hypothetical protein
MTTRISRGWAGLALLAAAGFAQAGGSWTDSPLGKAKFGEVWNSQAFSPEALSGRVVVVKTWADG